MRFRRDWWEVLWRAWSMRFLGLIILVQAADAALPWFRDSLPISDRWFAVLTLIFAFAAGLSRLVPQKGITPPAASGKASNAGQ